MHKANFEPNTLIFSSMGDQSTLSIEEVMTLIGEYYSTSILLKT